MIEHYNAFISYRHAPLDSAVAAEVQKRLERFRIPKAIRKKCGIRRIDRIFRDKEELLITSDLNETIEQALTHSDFLIVICSFATKESVWVQREIEFFLKTHSRDKVLTVVAEGEPVDVVPQILMEQQVTVKLDSGEEELVTMPMEPLSCDYRGSFRKAQKEELPRLAAAILGCSYDELKQRQRQYRIRRMALAFSAVAVLLTALTVYYAWSASQIRQNYIQALRNESQNLSREALGLLEEGDRLTAIETALAALPKDDKDLRPVIPQAEYALSQAANAYRGPDSNWYAVENAFSHGGKLDDFLINNEETHLIVRHSGNAVTVWDLASRSQVFEKVFPNQLYQAHLCGDDRLLALAREGLFCYEYRTGTLLWEHLYPQGYGDAMTFSAAADAPRVAILEEGHLVILDAADGRALQKHPMPTYTYYDKYSEEDKTGTYSIEDFFFSPDGNTLLLHLNGVDNDFISFYDVPSDTLTLSKLDFFMIYNAAFTANGNVIFTGDYVLRWNNYRSYNVYCFDNGFMDVVCMNPKGEILWADGIDYADICVGIPGEIVFFDCPNADGTPVPAVACTQGEEMEIYDLATGEVLRSATFPAVITDVSRWDKHLTVILSDGSSCTYWIESGEIYAVRYCIDDIDLAAGRDHLYVSNSTTGDVLLYTYGLHDESWTPLQTFGQPIDNLASDRVTGGTTLLYSSLQKDPFTVIQGSTRSMWCHDALPEELTENWSFMNLDPTGEFLLFCGYDKDTSKYRIGAYNYKTDTVTENWLVLTESISSYEVQFLKDSVGYLSIFATDEGVGTGGVVIQNSDGTVRKFPVEEVEEDTYFHSLQISSTENWALLQDSNRYLYTVDLQTGDTFHTKPITVTAMYPVWAESSDLFFVNDENCIRAFDGKCQEVYTIDCEGKLPNSLFAAGDSLYVLYGTTNFSRYQVSDGALLAELACDIGKTVSRDPRWEISKDGTLALQNFDALFLMDAQTLALRAKVAEFCLGYDLEAGLIYVDSSPKDGDYQIGYYEIYDYKELIELAKQQLS